MSNRNSRGVMRGRREAAAWSGPKVLVIREHHGTFYMDASTQEAFDRSVLRILKGRLAQDDMYMFGDEERLEAERAVARKDARNAWAILRDRFDHADERIDLEKIETRYYSEEDDEDSV